MFPPRTIRSIVTCVLACGLLAITTSSAVARPTDDARAGAPTSSLAGTTSKTPAAACAPNLPDGASMSCLEELTTPRQDLRSPDARDAANAEYIARQVEQYYESLGREPVAQPAVPAPADDSPWLPISVIAGTLALVLASTALVLRRRRTATV